VAVVELVGLDGYDSSGCSFDAGRIAHTRFLPFRSCGRVPDNWTTTTAAARAAAAGTRVHRLDAAPDIGLNILVGTVGVAYHIFVVAVDDSVVVGRPLAEWDSADIAVADGGSQVVVAGRPMLPPLALMMPRTGAVWPLVPWHPKLSGPFDSFRGPFLFAAPNFAHTFQHSYSHGPSCNFVHWTCPYWQCSRPRDSIAADGFACRRRSVWAEEVARLATKCSCGRVFEAL
jgi:hypothetical protein